MKTQSFRLRNLAHKYDGENYASKLTLSLATSVPVRQDPRSESSSSFKTAVIDLLSPPERDGFRMIDCPGVVQTCRGVIFMPGVLGVCANKSARVRDITLKIYSNFKKRRENLVSINWCYTCLRYKVFSLFVGCNNLGFIVYWTCLKAYKRVKSRVIIFMYSFDILNTTKRKTQ